MIPLAPFGRTGHDSTRVIFGAAALGTMRQDKADEVLEVLLEFGVNHIDTAASYGDSELRVAPWLPGRSFFLATKTGDRTGNGARSSLERSLTRLGVDHVDLIQLHNLVEPDEWDVAFGPGGAVEALAKARDEGLVRFIGVTGHGLRIAPMHLRSLNAFDFDSVLLPYNYALVSSSAAYAADFEAVLDLSASRHVAVQTIKSVARRRWEPSSTAPHFSWYEPLADSSAIDRAVRFVLARQGVFLNSSSDAHLLRATLTAAAAGAYVVPSPDQMDADVDAHGITPLFDGVDLERI